MIAKNTWAAMQGRKALKITWDDGPNATYDSVAYRKTLEASAAKPGKVVRNEGDVTAAMSSAAKRIEAQYYLPHLAHASMEPPAATASIVNGKCQVFGCFQSPQAARDLVAKRLGMPSENVTVNVTLLGGGFGRKSKPDYGVEAAVLSKAMDGRPVKVVWTRDVIFTVLPHRLGQHLSPRRRGPSGCVAAPERRADDHVGLRRDQVQEANWELGMGVISVPFTIPTSDRESGGDRFAASASSVGVEHPARVRGAVVRLRDGGRAQARSKDYLLESSAPRGSCRPECSPTWNHGENPERYPVDRAACGVAESPREAHWGRGCRKGTASASLPTTASCPSLRSSRWRSTRRAR